MKSIIINCPVPDCRKMLMKNAYLRPGSYLTTKCYYCGEIITVISENGRLVIKQEGHDHEAGLTDDEENAIINLHL